MNLRYQSFIEVLHTDTHSCPSLGTRLIKSIKRISRTYSFQLRNSRCQSQNLTRTFLQISQSFTEALPTNSPSCREKTSSPLPTRSPSYQKKSSSHLQKTLGLTSVRPPGHPQFHARALQSFYVDVFWSRSLSAGSLPSLCTPPKSPALPSPPPYKSTLLYQVDLSVY